MFGGFPGFGGFHEEGPSEPIDNEGYYKVLGVDKDATPQQIKKAFYKKAMTHHPDKGGDEELFKEMQAAYETLTDEEKRARYDQGGKAALEQGGGGATSMHDIFEMFTGGGGHPRRRGKPKGDDVVFPLKVKLEDLYNGMSKKLRLTKNVICVQCTGQGTKSGNTSKCHDCNGTGHRMVVQQIGPGMIQQMQTRCMACKGSGSVIPDADRCLTCKGKKVTKEKKTLEVFVEKGMRHRQKIVFKGEADQSPDTEPGNVVVVLQMLEHPHFVRDGMNLVVQKKVGLVEALCGTVFTITHLDGRKVRVNTMNTGEVIKHGQVKSVEGEGMPRRGSPFEKGHLFIKFDVVFPDDKSFSQNQKKKLRNILPLPLNDADAGGPAPHDAEDVTMTDVSMEEVRARQEAYRKAEAYEEDEDDDHHHGHGGAQCRQQ